MEVQLYSFADFCATLGGVNKLEVLVWVPCTLLGFGRDASPQSEDVIFKT